MLFKNLKRDVLELYEATQDLTEQPAWNEDKIVEKVVASRAAIMAGTTVPQEPVQAIPAMDGLDAILAQHATDDEVLQQIAHHVASIS